MESDVSQPLPENISNSDVIVVAWSQVAKQQSINSDTVILNRDSHDEGYIEFDLMDEQEICKRRMAALVEVVITYGTACPKHWEKSTFGSRVYVMAQEDPSNYNCLSVHVNNVLVFGCQGRQPSVQQLCQEVRRAMEGERPALIPYTAAAVCDFLVACKKHKYRI